MAVKMFGPGHFRVEVTTRTDSGMVAVTRGAIDVFGDGQRWSFQGGKVLIDFSGRVILEEPGATLIYRVAHKNILLLSVRGVGDQRSYRGGSKVRPGVYSF